MNKIRNAAKAIIIEDDKILLIKHKNNYYTLPGGGQNHNETLEEALKRECLEEIGGEVQVKEVRFITEYIGDRHEDSIHDEGFHQLDVFFECDLIGHVALDEANQMDETQEDVKWIPLDDLDTIVLYPKTLIHHIKGISKSIYLGEMT